MEGGYNKKLAFWNIGVVSTRIRTLIDQPDAVVVAVALEESVYLKNQISLGPNWSFFS